MFGFQCVFVLKNTKNTKFKKQEEFSKNTISQEEFSKTGTKKAPYSTSLQIGFLMLTDATLTIVPLFCLILAISYMAQKLSQSFQILVYWPSQRLNYYLQLDVEVEL